MLDEKEKLFGKIVQSQRRLGEKKELHRKSSKVLDEKEGLFRKIVQSQRRLDEKKELREK